MALFVDRVEIKVRAGNGGNGCVSFHREKFVQQGGPDGGDGGRGGNVVLVATLNMNTLMDFRYVRQYAAENGADGAGGKCTGKRGADIVIRVPQGTVVRESAGGRVVADMFEPDVPLVLLRGGRGGYGNARFATPTRQAPAFAKPGEKVPECGFVLELKSIADAGLVGFPNVGKSTLLAAVTSAKPKIANYHFTTLTPNLGIVRQDEYSFVLADIPGLVEGASRGIGLGQDFLRHVERTRVLVHVIDVSGSEGRDPVDDFDVICGELERYGDLASRPMIVAANKTDLPDSAENLERLRAHVEGRALAVHAISAATRQGLMPLMRELTKMLRALPPLEPFEIDIPEQDIEPGERDAYEVLRKDGAYEVTGAAMDRLIDSVNFSDYLSLNWFHRTLRRIGVIDALRAQGAQEGDTVSIAGMEFDFVE